MGHPILAELVSFVPQLAAGKFVAQDDDFVVSWRETGFFRCLFSRARYKTLPR
jgi:hypothetical protein